MQAFNKKMRINRVFDSFIRKMKGGKSNKRLRNQTFYTFRLYTLHFTLLALRQTFRNSTHSANLQPEINIFLR
jgi:hypothetical protein